MMKRLFRKILTCALVAVLFVTGSALATALNDDQKLDAYYSLTISYINSGEYDKALTYIEACLEMCAEDDVELKADLYLKRGCVYTMMQQYDEAIKALDEAIKLQPELADAYLVKAQVYSETGDAAKAEECLGKYMELDPEDVSMYITLGELAASRGDYEGAISQYTAYIDRAGDTVDKSAYYQRGVYEMQLEKYPEAAADFTMTVETEGFEASSLYNRAVCELQQQSYEQALADFTACYDTDTHYDGLLYNRGICRMMLNDYEGALADFNEAIETESFVADSYYNSGVCHMQLQMNAEAIGDFTRYIGDDAVQPQTTALPEAEETAPAEELDDLPEDEGEPEPTATAAQEQREVDMAWYYRGLCYMALEYYEPAMTDFTACVGAEITLPDATYNRGLCYLLLDRFTESAADFGWCIGNDVEPYGSRYYRSYAFIGQEMYDNAIDDLTVCIDNGYSVDVCYYQRALCYQAKGDEESYLADLERSLTPAATEEAGKE